MESTTIDTKMIEQLQALYSQEFELVQHDLGKTEQLVKQKMQLLGQGLLQRLVSWARNGYHGSGISCQCGGLMKSVQHRSRDIHSLFGWIRLKRAYYYCPGCGRSTTCFEKAKDWHFKRLSAFFAASAGTALAQIFLLFRIRERWCTMILSRQCREKEAKTERMRATFLQIVRMSQFPGFEEIEIRLVAKNTYDNWPRIR